jgi:NAD(P)-dependent dehydrogenase (short-subunit alcohol dehydrogenase family)
MNQKERTIYALVTGANRGIGKEIVRQLARRGVRVMLTARDEQKGRDACRELQDEGLTVDFCKLEVTSEKDIAALVASITSRWGRLDVLINNAGILIDHDDGILNLDLTVFRTTMETNLYAKLRMSQALFPFLKMSNCARIINLSSGLGLLRGMGAGDVAYSVSKTALNALTIKLNAEFRAHGILVHAMCPGWTQTDMGGPRAWRTVEQAADTAVWLAMEYDGPGGCFFQDRKPIEW